MAFAFNKPVILIETNIRAVFIHHFFTGDEPIPDSALIPLVEKMLDRDNPGKWYNALMDYGTFLKRVYANPARRSAHHQRQSPFEGSVRQVRGAVIRLILEKVTIPTTDAMQELPFDENRVRRTIDQLEREGIIATRGGFLSIV
jgi:A/G-specific adenine glycosylase